MKFVGQGFQKLEPEQDTQTRFFVPLTLTSTRDLEQQSWLRYSEGVPVY